MKIIDLLNKIANGEELPKKIKYDGVVYVIAEDEYYMENDLETPLFINVVERGIYYLNDEVEILDTPKGIEKLNTLFDEDGRCDGVYMTTNSFEYKNRVKINELIEVVNNLDK